MSKARDIIRILLKHQGVNIWGSWRKRNRHWRKKLWNIFTNYYVKLLQHWKGYIFLESLRRWRDNIVQNFIVIFNIGNGNSLTRTNTINIETRKTSGKGSILTWPKFLFQNVSQYVTTNHANWKYQKVLVKNMNKENNMTLWHIKHKKRLLFCNINHGKHAYMDELVSPIVIS